MTHKTECEAGLTACERVYKRAVVSAKHFEEMLSKGAYDNLSDDAVNAIWHLFNDHSANWADMYAQGCR